MLIIHTVSKDVVPAITGCQYSKFLATECLKDALIYMVLRGDQTRINDLKIQFKGNCRRSINLQRMIVGQSQIHDRHPSSDTGSHSKGFSRGGGTLFVSG